MTHVEFIEKVRAEYWKDWEDNPTEEKEVVAFREGMDFAFVYLIHRLKNGGEE